MQTAANPYLIKDLSRLSGHSVYTIKFYLKIGLIREIGRSPETRFRYFDDSTVEQLSRIRTLRKERKSLAQIQELIADSRLKTQDSGGEATPLVSSLGSRVAGLG